MKPNHKFLRVVLGAAVGAMMWAGCASQREIANEPAGASYDRAPEPALDSQSEFIKWHADTHPEWREGWNMTFPVAPDNANPAEVSTTVEQPTLAPPEGR